MDNSRNIYNKAVAISSIVVFFFATLACYAQDSKESSRIKLGRKPSMGSSKIKEKTIAVNKINDYLLNKAVMATSRNDKKCSSEEIKPYLIIKERFDDNIFKTKDGKEHDFITSITPGIEFGDKSIWTEGDPKIFLDIGTKFEIYAKNQKATAVSPFVNCDFGNKIISLFYRGKRAQVPVSEIEETRQKKIVAKWENTGGINFNKNFGKTYTRAGYSHKNIFYEDEDRKISNQDSDIVFIEEGLNVSSKSSIYTKYTRDMRRYPKRHDSDRVFDRLIGGLRNDISPKISTNAWAGVNFTTVEDEDTKAHFDYGAGLDYDITKSFSLDATMSKATDESIFTEKGTTETIEKYKYKIGCKYNPPFAKKVTLKGNASYSKSDYEFGGEDKTYVLGAGLDHKIREWIVFLGEYRYTKKESDRGSFGYVDNVIILTLKMEF